MIHLCNFRLSLDIAKDSERLSVAGIIETVKEDLSSSQKVSRTCEL